MRQPAQIENQKRVGATIRRLRLEQGLTQEDLAHAAGLNYKTVGRIERGQGSQHTDTLIDVARALSVPAGELLKGVK